MLTSQKSSYAVRSIEQWVVCFNTYVSLIALQQPARVPDLLEYTSVIIKASQKFKGLAWLLYDSHFRCMTAATRCNKWAEVDTSLWTLHFGSAKPKQVCKDCFEPGHLYCDMESTAEADTPGKNPKERPLRRQTPYNLPVCLRWNRPWGCRMSDAVTAIIPSTRYTSALENTERRATGMKRVRIPFDPRGWSPVTLKQLPEHAHPHQRFSNLSPTIPIKVTHDRHSSSTIIYS